nr:amidohydrolase family protein [Bacteroidota bacterium]
AHMLLAVHAEDEATIRANLAAAVAEWGEEIPIEEHPLIRSAEACYISSSNAVKLARHHGTRLHILHISTEKEIDLFQPGSLENKRITAEACVHHLWFTDEDHASKGTLIKWNPAVKTSADRNAIRRAVNDDRIDVIATDHAPHTLEEKQQLYQKCPSGGPLVQHSLVAMMEMVNQDIFSMEKLVEKMCQAPAMLFNIDRRGFIREGYFADMVLVDPNSSWTVTRENILYKCGWSPFEGQRFTSKVMDTWVNGRMVFANGRVDREVRGERLLFLR